MKALARKNVNLEECVSFMGGAYDHLIPLSLNTSSPRRATIYTQPGRNKSGCTPSSSIKL